MSDKSQEKIKNTLMDEEEERSQLKLEQSSTETHSNSRQYNREYLQNRLYSNRLHKQRIEKLENLLFEQEIAISKAENQFKQNIGDHEESFGKTIMRGRYETEESYCFFYEGNKMSTPTTPPTSAAYFERYLESQRSRMKGSQIVQQCNKQVSKLCGAIEGVKAVNLHLSKVLAEKEERLQEKDKEIESVKISLEIVKSKLKAMSKKALGDVNGTEITEATEMTESGLHDLEEEILIISKKKNERDSEIIKLNETIEKAVCRAHELEEKTLSLENELKDMKTIQLKEKDEEFLKLTTAFKESQKKLCELKKELEEQRLKEYEVQKDFDFFQNEYDTMVEEQTNLQVKVNELIGKNEVLTTKFSEIEHDRAELQLCLATSLNEKQELQSKLIESNQEKLQAESDKEKLMQELEQMRKEKIENWNTINDLKRQIQDLSEATGERSELQTKLNELNSELAEWERAFQEKRDLLKQLKDCKIAKNEIKQKAEEQKLKMDAIKKEFEKSKLYSSSLEQRLQVYEGREQQLQASKMKTELEFEVTNLREELRHLRATLKASDKLRAQLKELQAIHTATIDQHEAFRNQVAILRTDFCDVQRHLQRKNEKLCSELKELQSKCAALEETNTKLVARNKQIKAHLLDKQSDAIEQAKILKLLHELQDERRALQESIETTILKSQKCTAMLQMKLEIQEKACEDLRASFNVKEADFENAKQMLENEISSLKCEKEILVERLELFKEQIDTCENLNNSLEKNTPPQNSTLECGSPCKITKKTSTEDKLSSIEKKRKNRRLSAHDENRRQSVLNA